jgi:signal transduction histidine kinase
MAVVHAKADREYLASCEALSAAARLISSLPEGEQVFLAIAEAAVTLLGARIARVWADDPAEEILREKSRFCADDATLRLMRDGTELRYHEGIIGPAFVSGVPRFVADVQEEPLFRDPRFAQEAGLHGFAVIPLTIGDRVLGVLSILFGEVRAFTAAEQETMKVLGREAAVAINTARLLQQSERRRQTAESLAALARSVSQSLETGQIAWRAVEAVCEVVGAESAALLRLEQGSGDLAVLAARGDIASVLDGPAVFAGGAGVPAVAVHGGRPAMSADMLTDPRIALSPALRARIQAGSLRVVLSVPLLANDTVVGLLGLWNGPGRLYTLEEIALAQAFADQVALALENARLYEAAQRAYTELQETQQRLAQTQRLEAIGRLAGGVAHDFANLLTVMGGRAAISKRRATCDAATREDLALIEATAARGGRLTNQLLAFSRKQTLQPRVFDLNALVAEMRTMLVRLIGEDLEIVSVLTPGLGPVEADPGQLEQVILNLVVNARDAMPRGGRLTIETQDAALDEAALAATEGLRLGPYVMLRVVDTGCGMDAETQSHIFEPFFTTKERGRGTGLGLATVYGIVRQSGGHITVDSTPGRGTTFSIYLPRAADLSGPGRPEAEPAAGGTETVLLVEDDAEVRRLVSGVLQARGYCVLEAADGREGTRLADEYPGPIDLLLTDVVMPALGGPVLAASFERGRPGAPVLFMSGYTHDAITRYGATGPADRLLQKPFSPDRLLQRVRETLDASPAVVVASR